MGGPVFGPRLCEHRSLRPAPSWFPLAVPVPVVFLLRRPLDCCYYGRGFGYSERERLPLLPQPAPVTPRTCSRVHHRRLLQFVFEQSLKSMAGPILSHVSIVEQGVPVSGANLDVAARPSCLILTGKCSGRTGWRLKAMFCAMCFLLHRLRTVLESRAGPIMSHDQHQRCFCTEAFVVKWLRHGCTGQWMGW